MSTQLLQPRQPHNHYSHPPPADQPTPQSPPFYHMSGNYAQPTSPPSNYKPSVMTTNNSLLTPASFTTANGSHELDDVEMMDAGNYETVSLDGANKRRRRVSAEEEMGRGETIPPNLRHPDGSAAGATELDPDVLKLMSQPDTGPFHLVAEKQHETSYPLPSDDLLRLYSLGTLVHKVQRVDPENAQKYKLRKSYRRFTQHLPGKDDVEITKTDLNEYMHTAFETKGNEKWEGKDWSRTRLYYLNAVPEQDWRATFASSEKAIPRISSSESGAGAGDWSAFKAKLGKGMKSWAPGPLEDFDQSKLALDDPNNMRKIPPMTTNRPAPSHSAVGTPRMNGGPLSRPGTPSAAQIKTEPNSANRSMRQGKRRRYDEASYEGYQHDDDDGDAGGGGGRKPGQNDGAWNGRDRGMGGPAKKKKVEPGYMGNGGGWGSGMGR